MLRKLIFVVAFTAVTVFAQTNRIDTRTRNDSTYVAKTGDEAISGVKQFTNGIKLPGFTPGNCLTVDGTNKVVTTPCGGVAIDGVISDGNHGMQVTGGVSATTIGGVRYASQSGDKSTNGISTAQANNSTVIAGPDYPFTEAPGMTSFTASPIHYQNLRGSWEDNFFRNPQYGHGDYFLFNSGYTGFLTHQTGKNDYCMFDQDPAAGNANQSYGCQNLAQYSLFPGWSRGNPVGLSQASNWTIQSLLNPTIVARSNGITEGIDLLQYKTGVGDNAALYCTLYGAGGYTATSDEGTKCYSGNTNEINTVYTGTCSSGCTNGSTGFKLSVANGVQGPGRYVINTTVGPTYTGKFTAAGNSALIGGGAMYAITVDQTVPVSTAWGTIATANPVINPNPPFTTNTTFNVTLSGGSPGNFTAGSLVCFQGNFHEQAIITSAGAPSGGIQSLTIPLRQPHASGSVIMQGGMCGSGIEFTGNTFNSRQYTFDVVGSTDANTLQVVWFKAGTNETILATSYLAPLLATYTLTTATASFGTTVYGVTTGTSPEPYNGNTFVFSGLSDAALNGNNCTNAQFTDSTHFTCTMAGLTGTHTTGTTGLASQGLNGFKTWAIAEVTDVRNNTLNPPQADGTFAVEPNALVMHNGDTLNELNHYAGRFQSLFQSLNPLNPYTVSNGNFQQFSGRGIYGNLSITGNAYNATLNNNANTNYVGLGGNQYAPEWWHLDAPYGIGMLARFAPAPNQAFLNILQNTTQTNNRDYNALLWTWATKAGVFSDKVNLFYGDVTSTIPRVNTIGGTVVAFATPTFGAATQVGNITFAVMTTPTLTVTCSPTGGSLADGTYAYKVQARGGSLYSAATAEVTGTVTGGSGNGSCALSWTPVANATTAYNVYGRTAGSTARMTAISTTGITATYAVDRGDVTPSGGTDTPVQPGIVSIGSVGFLSPSTAFNGTLQAPAGVAGNYTVTLPAVTSTLATTIASGTAVMTTGAIGAGACGSTVTVTATGTLTTDAIAHAYNASVGANPGVLILNAWPTAGNVNFAYCNPTAGSVTPTAATVNWRVTR